MIKLKVGLVQQKNCDDKEKNKQKLSFNIRECANKGAKLIVLQELHNTLYFCQTENVENFELSETIPGPSCDFFGHLAKELNIVLVTSIFEKRTPGLYHNTSVVFENDGSIAGIYRKMHIPDDPGFYEKFYFSPGDLGFIPVKTSVGKLGVMVCWDQWFPEAARLMTLGGADMLIYPTAIGWDPNDDKDEQIRQLDSWQIIQRSHAVANGLPVISVNRVGMESDPSEVTNGIQFWGNSFICGPQGEILSQADSKNEENLIVNIDIERSENVRRIWPFLRDRRIDAYKNLRKRFL